MAARGPRSGDRQANAEGRLKGPGGRAVKRPLGWPRYVGERRLADGTVCYYWYPHRRDLAAGFGIRCEALGASYGAAVDRANFLNKVLDDWRAGQGGGVPGGGATRFGSLAWMFAIFCQTKS